MTEYKPVKKRFPEDPPFIIFDLDGTLANVKHRLHHIKNPEGKKNFDAFNDAMTDDVPNKAVVQVFKRMCCNSHSANNNPCIIVTGRPETHREQTQNWLMKYGLVPTYLFMRPAGDYRSDVEIKREIVEKYIKDAEVLFVMDDRQCVVDLWRELGYKCFQVAHGDY